jgi:hypothetical protein
MIKFQVSDRHRTVSPGPGPENRRDPARGRGVGHRVSAAGLSDSAEPGPRLRAKGTLIFNIISSVTSLNTFENVKVLFDMVFL